MSQFRIIDKIDIGHDGPIANGPDGEEQLIHLAQGSMDGACGPYSLMMGLMICGLIDREDLIHLRKLDGRTNAGKLLSMLEKYQGFFRNGTEPSELVNMLEKSYPRALKAEYFKGTGVEVRNFVKKEIENNNPVILEIDFEKNSGHWVVVIGYEYQDDDNREPLRFLLLDPNSQSPITSAWNGIVNAYGTGGRYPYIWWGKDALGNEHGKVNLFCALSLCPTKNEKKNV